MGLFESLAYKTDLSYRDESAAKKNSGGILFSFSFFLYLGLNWLIVIILIVKNSYNHIIYKHYNAKHDKSDLVFNKTVHKYHL